ncbi:hypothetical protein [Streptomyces malaysiensis]|uniref:hypothetical protein n=1 Tax=Streptomyces malaysiensis TaxID=92644 RepID=UPI0011E4D143|nr:hypothetical protein [Streptomyces autolyticus]
MIVVIAFPLLWLLILPGVWWSWSLFIVLLVLVVCLCIIGLQQTFNPPDEPAPEDSGAGGQS